MPVAHPCLVTAREIEVIDVITRIADEELAEYRKLETEMKVLESGCVNLSWEQACAIVDATRDFWIRMYEQYDLDEDEAYEIDSVRGLILVGE